MRLVLVFENAKDSLVVAGTKHRLDHRPYALTGVQACAVVPARLAYQRAFDMVRRFVAPMPGARRVVKF